MLEVIKSFFQLSAEVGIFYVFLIRNDVQKMDVLLLKNVLIVFYFFVCHYKLYVDFSVHFFSIIIFHFILLMYNAFYKIKEILLFSV